MIGKVFILALEADFAFLVLLGGDETQFFWLWFGVFCHEKMEFRDDQMIEGCLLMNANENEVF